MREIVMVFNSGLDVFKVDNTGDAPERKTRCNPFAGNT